MVNGTRAGRLPALFVSVPAALALAALAACGGGKTPGVPFPDPGPADVPEAIAPETFEATPDPIAPDPAPDVPEPPEVEDRAEDRPGETGDPGCVPGDGIGCPCVTGEECPEGWRCAVCVGGADPQYCCIDPFVTLCRPCKADVDCPPALAVADTRHLCIDHGAAGRFCGVGCETSDDCPDSVDGVRFDCAEVQSGDGRVRQCVPEGDADCPCTEEFKDHGYLTVCHVENDAGRCIGERTCDSVCSARVPAVESCNLVDDDCNGKTDDGIPATPCPLENAWGTCPGTSVCAGGEIDCAGTWPAEETCNGRDDDCDGTTDEESPDLDGDGLADCFDPDDDGDGIPDALDNCPAVANAGQEDMDFDLVGDACDCDNDSDGVANNGPACPVVRHEDNCPFTSNKDQADLDADGIGDACDCDADDDGVANPHKVAPLVPGAACPVPGHPDNCLAVANPGQADLDGDGIGDACDCDLDGDEVPNANAGCPAPPKPDNCPAVPNPDQADWNKDGVGDACACDQDGDGVPEAKDACPPAPDPDNCPYAFNPGQGDHDGDGLGDACDCDQDDDGVANAAAGCPACGGTCDNCPFTANPGQEDMDRNGRGDACEEDWDHDGVPNDDDVCPLVPDPGQEDLDSDSIGDACDDDLDGDGAPNGVDNCARGYNPGQEDLDGDGLGDACDPDIDGDGDPNPTDCLPYDPLISSLAIEACNGHDDNCNSLTDEENSIGCAVYFYDGDRDGFGGALTKCLCAPIGFYDATVAGDCDDGDAAVSPTATEVCANGRDENCNGHQLEENAIGCSKFYYDGDHDTWGTDKFKCYCEPVGDWSRNVPGDCDDTDATVNPGEREVCGDGKDNDCSGTENDENASNSKPFFRDEDGDGYGGPESKMFCAATGTWRAETSGDCDDADAAVNPSAAEVCNNGKDDDCNGDQDVPDSVGCETRYADRDADTYGDPVSSRCLCGPAYPFLTSDNTDCDDMNPLANPAGVEICNGVDENCANGPDDGDPLQTCGAIPHGGYRCVAGSCEVGSCETGWFDVNGIAPDGCECEQDATDATANTCEAAADEGEVNETDLSRTLTGKIVSPDDVDWYRFRANDAEDTGSLAEPGHDRFAVRIQLLYPSDKTVAFQVLRGTCQENPTCGGDSDAYEWFTDFDGIGPAAQPAGEDPCLTLPVDQGGTGHHWDCEPGTACCEQSGAEVCPEPEKARRHCLDDSSYYYVKVYWASGAPFTRDCGATRYAITFDNGR